MNTQFEAPQAPSPADPSAAPVPPPTAPAAAVSGETDGDGTMKSFQLSSMTPSALNPAVSPRGIWKFLYNSNPFYAVSAMLLLYAQATAFTVGRPATDALIALGLFAGFSTLLGVTAVFIVRWGRVWNDARSILVIIMLLLLALSVGVDDLLFAGNRLGLLLLGAGFAFAVGLLATLRRALNLRLERSFALASIALLALFFLYPVVSAHLVLAFPDHREPGMWGVLLFPVAAALLMLLFLPAARQGRRLAEHSGTPWTAPCYPWTILAVLMIGIAARIFWSSVILAFATGSARLLHNGFGGYMLLPVLFAAGLLLLEYQKANGVRFAKTVLILPAIMAATTINYAGNPDPAFRAFHHLVFSGAFTTAVLGLGAAALYYLWAHLRGFRGGDLGFLATLALAMLFQVGTLWIWGTAALLLPTLLLLRMLRCNDTFHRLLFALALVLSGTWLLEGTGFGREWVQLLQPFSGKLSYAATVGCFMVAGLLGRDPLARYLRRLGSSLWIVGGTLLLIPQVARFTQPGSAPPALFVAVFAGVWLVGTVYCLLCRGRFHYALLAFQTLSNTGFVLIFTARLVHSPRVLWFILAVLGCFAAAVLISLHKGSKLRAADRPAPAGADHG